MQQRGAWKKITLAGALPLSLFMGWSAGPAAAEGQTPESQPPDIQWQKSYGGDIRLTEMQQTPDNGYIVTGTTNEGKAFLAAADEQGNEQWSKALQLSENGKNVTVASVQHTKDGAYIIGGTIPSFHFRYVDYYIAKTDAKGEILWKEVVGSGAYGHFHMIRETTDGGFVYVEFTESLNSGSFHTSAVKLDGNGKQQWAASLGGGRADSPYVEASSVQQTADGGYAIAGSRAAGETELVKTDASGEEQWTKTVGDGQAVSLMNATDGGYLLGLPQRVVKTDAAASMQWSKSINSVAKAIPTKDGGAAILTSPAGIVKLTVQSLPRQNGLKLDSEDYSLSVGQSLDTTAKVYVY